MMIFRVVPYPVFSKNNSSMADVPQLHGRSRLSLPSAPAPIGRSRGGASSIVKRETSQGRKRVVENRGPRRGKKRAPNVSAVATGEIVHICRSQEGRIVYIYENNLARTAGTMKSELGTTRGFVPRAASF